MRAKIFTLPTEIRIKIVAKEAGSLGILSGSSEKILPSNLISEKVSFPEGFMDSMEEGNCAVTDFRSRKGCFSMQTVFPFEVQ